MDSACSTYGGKKHFIRFLDWEPGKYVMLEKRRRRWEDNIKIFLRVRMRRHRLNWFG